MKLKTWELALFTAFVVAILWGLLLDNSQQNLANELVRLHVVPHSNEEIDQALKLEVRDSVQAYLRDTLAQANSSDDAQTIILAHTEALESLARDVLSEFGQTLPVRVTLGQASFPTRAYGHFTLPAGNYTALQIHLGDASGQNWWCVVFPPLCFDVALGEMPDLAVMGLSEHELALIADDSGGVAFRFRALEFFDRFRG